MTRVCETRMPRRQQSQIWQKSLSPIFWPAPSPGACHARKVWGTNKWTYSPSLVTTSSPKLCILLFVCKRDGITDRQTNGLTDGRTIRLLDAPGGPFRIGAYKSRRVCETLCPRQQQFKKLFLAWRSKSRSQDLGVIWKGVISGVSMPNMKSLSMIKKLKRRYVYY